MTGILGMRVERGYRSCNFACFRVVVERAVVEVF
jgi:hypothetical protein